CLQTKKSPWTF
nr:immunoglobulin light chain junction region [Macaca mulatta]